MAIDQWQMILDLREGNKALQISVAELRSKLDIANKEIERLNVWSSDSHVTQLEAKLDTASQNCEDNARHYLEAQAKLDYAEGVLTAIVGKPTHAISCGDKNNPFNNKEMIRGCNCGSMAVPVTRLSMDALDEIRGGPGRPSRTPDTSPFAQRYNVVTHDECQNKMENLSAVLRLVWRTAPIKHRKLIMDALNKYGNPGSPLRSPEESEKASED